MIDSILIFFQLSARQILFAWSLFVLMALIIIGFVVAGYKAFKTRANKK